MGVQRLRHPICVRPSVAILALWFAAGAGGCGGAETGSTDSVEAVALVSAVPVREGTLRSEAFAYGYVAPRPGSETTVSVPFESHVVSVNTVAGAHVSTGTSLVTVEPSADARTQIRQAKSVFDAERVRNESARHRYDLGLATVDDLAGSQSALDQARQRWGQLTGWDSTRAVRAGSAGTVDSIAVVAGQLVPPGQMLIRIVRTGRRLVRLGVDPAVAERLSRGQSVEIESLDSNGRHGTVSGSLRDIGQKINAVTRLVEVTVDVDSESNLWLSERVRARLDLMHEPGLIVPRSAVLPDGDRHFLFTVVSGKARRHEVSVIAETDSEALVDGDIAAGDSVLFVGNYEVHDGTRIRIDTGSERSGTVSNSQPKSGAAE